MESFGVKLVEIKPETSNVNSFLFDLDNHSFDYLPGQFLQLNLDIANCDQRCSSRNYSISSSPTETIKTGKIMIATKFSMSHSSIFKENLLKLKKGAEAKIRGPFGKFTLQEDFSRPAVMIAGGIGITPFRNMIKFATDKNLTLPIRLFYSNKTLNDIVWKNELNHLSKQNKNLTTVFTISDDSPADWSGETGRIDKEMIEKYITDLKKPIYYVCGPPSLVEAMISILQDLNIDPDSIRQEKFVGY